MSIAFDKLAALLGKPVDDKAVVDLVAKAKGKIGKDHITSKAGFEFALARPDGASNRTPKIVSTLFASEGVDLPKPFALGLSRAAVIALKPEKAWKMGKWAAKLDDPGVVRFYFTRNGIEIGAEMDDDVVGSYTATLREEATGGVDLATHPLHFETAPSDEPDHAALTGMGLLLGWATAKFGPSAKHASEGKKLAKREVTPRAFLIAHCGSKLTSLDVSPKLADFLHGYTHRMFIGDDHDALDATDRTIKKLLGLGRDDERAFTDDYLATFKVLSSPFYVPDSWAAVDRLAPILDARFADYEKTRFESAPDLKLYEKAVKARDAVTVTPDKKARTATGRVTAAALIACVGKPLADATTKATIAGAGMPIGKRIDEQANPALGISYMGNKANGKMQCDSVSFYAPKQTRYIRGLGKEVLFDGFTGELPRGVKLGDTRAVVTTKLGAPARAYEDSATWFPRKDRRVAAFFSKKGDKGVLVRLYFGFPPESGDPPVPPFGPDGMF